MSDREAEELIAIAVLEQVMRDRQRGDVRPAQAYVAEFPHHAELVNNLLAGDRPVFEIAGYRIEREIGRGGQSTVYLATDSQVAGRRIALKLLADGDVSSSVDLRLRREVEVLARLEHPGLCPIYATGKHHGRRFAAMRFVDGQTLREVFGLARGACAAPDRALTAQRVALIARVAEIVDFVHERGVVHRDLKPGNVMVQADASPVVLDFGLATLLEAGDLTVTKTGDILGTPAYMAPEQAEGRHQDVDARTDVFALGAMLYEAITGERAFQGASQLDVLQSIVRDEAPDARQRNRHVSRDLAVVTACALAKAPAQRYQSAEALAADLRRVLAGRPVQARRVGWLRRTAKWVRREPMLAGALGSALLGVSAALGTVGWKVAQDSFELERMRLTADAGSFSPFLDWLEHDARVLPSGMPELGRANRRARDLASYRARHDEQLAELRKGGEPVFAPGQPYSREARVLRERQAQLTHFERGMSSEPTPNETAALAALEAALREPLGWRFSDSAMQLLHDNLVGYTHALRSFDEPRASRNTAQRLRLWIRSAKAMGVAQEAHRPLWEAAHARVADPGHPVYGGRGIVLEPQEGLVPLGPDPDSKLEEFGLLAFLDEPWIAKTPLRDTDGRLTLDASLPIVLVLLAGGEAQVGTVEPVRTPTARAIYERVYPAPRQTVSLAPFFISKYEVTQAQWTRLTYIHQAAMQPGFPLPDGSTITPVHPVELVSWNEADTVLRRFGLCLPTEAQWEVACRSGTTTRWSTGDDVESLQAHANHAGNSIEAHPDRWSDVFLAHAPVGSLRPNAFGLHDMHGNVAEWCQDTYSSYDEPARPGDGLRSPAKVMSRIVRGGSWQDPPRRSQSWWRSVQAPTVANDAIGVRAARRLEGAMKKSGEKR